MNVRKALHARAVAQGGAARVVGMRPLTSQYGAVGQGCEKGVPHGSHRGPPSRAMHVSDGSEHESPQAQHG